MTKSTHTGAKIMAAAGAAALAAASAAYYFAFDKRAAKHRRKAKNWAHNAKAEVIKELKKLKNFSKPAYEGAVAGALKKYQGYKQAAPGEIEKLSRELKGYWGKISRMVAPTKKAPAKKKPAARQKRK